MLVTPTAVNQLNKVFVTAEGEKDVCLVGGIVDSLEIFLGFEETFVCLSNLSEAFVNFAEFK